MRVHCFLCKRPFEFGPLRAEGRGIHEWEIIVCQSCRIGNWDGIPPLSYPHLIEHLPRPNVLHIVHWLFSSNAKRWIKTG